MPKFADVILPLPLADTFTYSVPQDFEERIAEGCRVSVPLGKSKHYTALVQRLHDDEPEGYAVRPIEELLDDAPIVLPTQTKLWQWVSRYYLCSMGEIFKAAVPQGLKGEFKARTEQRIRVAKAYRNSRGMELAMASLSRAPRQKRLLNTYLQFIGGDIDNVTKEISRHKLIELAEVSPTVCKELIDKGIFECYEVEIGRLAYTSDEPAELNELNPVQQKAFEQINAQFDTKNTVLLHREEMERLGEHKVLFNTGLSPAWDEPAMLEWLDKGDNLLYCDTVGALGGTHLLDHPKVRCMNVSTGRTRQAFDRLSEKVLANIQKYLQKA